MGLLLSLVGRNVEGFGAEGLPYICHPPTTLWHAYTAVRILTMLYGRFLAHRIPRRPSKLGLVLRVDNSVRPDLVLLLAERGIALILTVFRSTTQSDSNAASFAFFSFPIP